MVATAMPDARSRSLSSADSTHALNTAKDEIEALKAQNVVQKRRLATLEKENANTRKQAEEEITRMKQSYEGEIETFLLQELAKVKKYEEELEICSAQLIEAETEKA